MGLAASALPDVGSVITGWFQRMTFGKISKSQVNGYTQEIVTEICSAGVRQPYSPQELKILKEGERSWDWSKLHCAVDVQLRLDDRVLISGVKFRVMKKTDYTEYGYLEYDIIEDYDDSPSVPL